MAKAPRLDGKPFSVRVFLKREIDRKALRVWLKDNTPGRFRLFDRGKSYIYLELFLSNIADATLVRFWWSEQFATTSFAESE